MESLNAAFMWCLRTSGEAVVLVGLILLLQVVLRHRLHARCHYALWLVLLVRMVLPWAPQSDLSVFNYVPGFGPVAEESAALPASIGASPVFVLSGEPLAVSTAAPKTPGWSLWTILAVAWLAVACLLGARVCVENWRFWRAIRRGRPLGDGDEARALLERCAALMGVSARVPLVSTDAVSSPALFGLIRPRLLVPEGILRNLSANDLRFVFLHELAHLKRRDILVSWLATLLQVAHWFNPVIWYAFHRMRADREVACDALALSCVAPEEAAQYGRTLVDILDSIHVGRRVPGMAGILEDRSQLKRRITMIALFKSSSYRWSILAVLLLALSAGVMLTDARAGAVARPESVTVPVVEEAYEGPREKTATEQALEKTIKELVNTLNKCVEIMTGLTPSVPDVKQWQEMLDAFEETIKTAEGTLEKKTMG